MAGYWSAYWYRGFIYGTEIARGLDVLELLPSEFLTEHENVAASTVAPATFNAQDQRRIDWSTRPVVARAYLDQLGRADTLSTGRRSALSGLLDRADAALADGAEAGLAGELTIAASEVRREAGAASGRSQARAGGAGGEPDQPVRGAAVGARTVRPLVPVRGRARAVR